ncbi:MAG: phosphatidate cytidylyltransferase [Spirochaetes bacterium]|nr:phosphatidate cytidylyltransferase [Spirochaetota bacterium]
MSVVVKRLLVFTIGVPLVVVFVLFLPFGSNFALNAVITVFSAIAAVEFSLMLKTKNLCIGKPAAAVLGALAPLSGVVMLVFNSPSWTAPLFLMAGACAVFISCVFTSEKDFDGIIGRIAAGIAVMVYPGVFLFWLVMMSAWQNAGIIILIFLLVNIACDSAAWLAGMLFGKGNRGVVAVSPNKSVAGFIGGAVGSAIIGVSALLIVPEVFTPRFDSVPVTVLAVGLSLCTGAVAAVGDLVESAIKRSCNFKDSGSLMLGRGGILDSVDSIAVAAPVFFLLYNVLFINHPS